MNWLIKGTLPGFGEAMGWAFVRSLKDGRVSFAHFDQNDLTLRIFHPHALRREEYNLAMVQRSIPKDLEHYQFSEIISCPNEICPHCGSPGREAR